MTDVPVLRLAGVGVRRDATTLLEGVDWTVEAGQHWVVLGRNGSGKTTLVRVASLYDHPSTGTVEVLGERLGRTDVRVLRRRIGYVSAAFADLVRPTLSATDVVMTAKYAALEPWWHAYEDADRERAARLIEDMGVHGRADHPFGTLSSGERQRVLLARAQMTDPAVLLADEPNAGLDLGGREELLAQFDRMAARPGAPPLVLVTHHVEEIPTATTHVLALRDGRVLAQGPIDDVLDAELLSTCFGIALRVGRDGRRWWARAAG
jgi:iron complex transport system ATP-binding protein